MTSPEIPPNCEDADSGESPPPNGSGMLAPIRQIIIFVLGMSVLVVGIAMIVLPGPAMVVIPAGLAILGTEFVWARRWLKYLKRRAQEVADWTSASMPHRKTECPSDVSSDHHPTDAARQNP